MGAPIKLTCPDIDKAIKRIKAAIRDCENAKKYATEENFKEYFDDIISSLDGLDWELEDLRKGNASLREWGDDLETQLENAATEINDLENKLQTP